MPFVNAVVVRRWILCAGMALAFAARAFAAAGDFVWIECEKPMASNITPKAEGARRTEWLSGNAWLVVNVEDAKVEAEIPKEGATFTYAFSAAKEGKYEVWHRVGFEFVRSLFEWRMDDGAWATITPEVLTTDLLELDVWCEVGWLKMGDQQLSAGEHKLQIRVPIRKDDKGKVQRILYASDAICISAGPFHPHGKLKPGESDLDEADANAAKQAFALPEAKAVGERASVALKGLWEICRNDEALPKVVDEPINDFPTDPHWKAIAVPGDKNTLRPDMMMAHRVWYRTKVNVPASAAGRAFFLTFPQNNLNTTVYVNGVYCGFNKFPYVHFDIDVTKAIKPGVNEVWVGIRDAWYGYATKPGDPMKLRRTFNIPPSFTGNGFQDLAWPVWKAWQAGILVTPTLTSVGGIYASDVFVKPSVAKKLLEAEITVENPGTAAVAGTVLCEAVNKKTGMVEKTSEKQAFPAVEAHSRAVVNVSFKWDDAKLWWPDEPNMYSLRVTVTADKSGDVSSTPFGFREWGGEGKNFTLNGVPWHGWNMGVAGSTPEQWLADYRKTHQTTMRMSGATQGGNLPFFGMSPDEALDWMDEHGVPVRRCGILDGEAIGYMAVENDPDLQKLYGTQIKMQLLNNWVEQMAAQVKAERNHPSVQIWSIENEWLYINCINLYGGLMDQFEAQAKRCADAVKAVDPTRLTMSDGGSANKDQSMPVHGNHYVADAMTKYPALAYEANPTGGGRGRWTWDEKRPRYLGEDFFFTGNHPELAAIGGEAALGGKASTLQACGLMLQILQQGYRWAEYGAWDFYLGGNDADDSQWKYFQPRVALVREWDWSFESGKPVKRTVGIFNDTHSQDPIVFAWKLVTPSLNGKSETTTYTVAPGGRKQIELTIPMPAVDARTDGQLELSLSVGGVEVFKDTKAVSILPPATKAAGREALNALNDKTLCVCDPSGAVGGFLKSINVAFTSLDDLKTLPEAAKVLIIGRDALDPAESTSSRLAAFAAAGRSVIVLEQKNPLKYQGVPADMETATNIGRVGFAEDLDHPAFKGLQQKDFFTWGTDEILYHNAYVKPTRGGKSLLQCDELLQNSALVEVPAGKGLLLLSQLCIGEKLADNVVAQHLLENLIGYGATYKQTFRPAVAFVKDSPLLAKTIDSIGVQSAKVDDVLAALSTPGAIAIISATPANLKTLADNLPKVQEFTKGGGWIVFNGLTPEGIESYNKIVGFDHMIRPFKRERVIFPPLRSPLTAGITTGDVAMYSSQRIFPWTEGNYVVSDEFNYVIDFDEVAAFGKSSFQAYDNIVNGFVNADGWPLIINFPAPADGGPFNLPITLPKPQTISEITWIQNTNYWPTTKLTLIFDSNKENPVTLTVPPNGDAQTFAINPSRSAKQVTLQLSEYDKIPGKIANLGIDNIYMKAQRPADFYQRVKQLLNVGGMMAYPAGTGRDAGGILLCNLNFKESEEVAINATKKRNIMAALLRNLRAPFAGGKSVIAGSNLAYSPIDLSKQANAFRNEQGWFGDKNTTFRDLPTGKQMMAGVQYDIYEFATSPVPTVVMIGGPGVPGNLPADVKGIRVGKKADALFFLQAARIDRRRNPDEIKKGQKFSLAKYVVNYADGKSEEVPVYAEVDVENYKQQSPAPVPGAQLAWTKAYEKSQESAAAYSMQWNNPRPNVEIVSIDLAPGADKVGVPALLAVTAAKSVEKK